MSNDRNLMAFRGLRGRNIDDQTKAMVDGYNSVTDMALDELGQLVLDLKRRVENLEAEFDPPSQDVEQ